ncbi:hypothetical protein NRB_49060 [Novosphingobium sp. 11B]
MLTAGAGASGVSEPDPHAVSATVTASNEETINRLRTWISLDDPRYNRQACWTLLTV